MVAMKNIKSALFITFGVLCIMLFAYQLMVQLLFIFIGLYLIHKGLVLRGKNMSSFVMRMCMGRF